MLRQIVIDEITILEPLHGKPWSIPCRFVESFEVGPAHSSIQSSNNAEGSLKVIHLAVRRACEGTAASRFIDYRKYQLDESTTDAIVSEGDIVQRLGQCRVFEITIKFSRLELSANVCPRCETIHDDMNQKNDNGWLRW
jgi:hypothetical protein